MNLLERYVGIDERMELRTLAEGQGALGLPVTSEELGKLDRVVELDAEVIRTEALDSILGTTLEVSTSLLDGRDIAIADKGHDYFLR